MLMFNDLVWNDHQQTFEYLTPEHSKLYLSIKDSSDPKDKTIKLLLELLANRSRAAHRASKY